MSGIAIYMEGGGDGRDTKVALRQGMDAFLTELKEVARTKSWHWKLVPCGGRQAAFDAFLHARRTSDMAIVALLVDAEGHAGASPCAHLAERDGWHLNDVPEDVVHLMVQVMESWIVADAAALSAYYGQGFKANRLPRAQDLETVAKASISAALEQASRATRKGAYHKIRHASDLLQRIDPHKVRQRCASCERLFRTLGILIKKA